MISISAFWRLLSAVVLGETTDNRWTIDPDG
jgi:hypothetical protein